MSKEKKLIEDEKFHHEERGTGVANDENVFASYNHKCPKCGYGKAEIIDLGAQYSDENELVMLKCGKCGYTERLDKKTS